MPLVSKLGAIECSCVCGCSLFFLPLFLFLILIFICIYCWKNCASKTPSDCHFLGLSWGRSSGSWLLKFLQRAWKDGWGWDGEWQRYGSGIWKDDLHTKPGWERDVKIHKGRYFGLCGDGVDVESGVFLDNVPCHQRLSTKHWTGKDSVT